MLKFRVRLFLLACTLKDNTLVIVTVRKQRPHPQTLGGGAGDTQMLPGLLLRVGIPLARPDADHRECDAGLRLIGWFVKSD